jgi:hypothetical protein
MKIRKVQEKKRKAHSSEMNNEQQRAKQLRNRIGAHLT